MNLLELWGPGERQRTDTPNKVCFEDRGEEVAVARRGQGNNVLLEDLDEMAKEREPKRSILLPRDQFNICDDLACDGRYKTVRPVGQELGDSVGKLPRVDSPGRRGLVIKTSSAYTTVIVKKVLARLEELRYVECAD
jgi:hypothetical protein